MVMIETTRENLESLVDYWLSPETALHRLEEKGPLEYISSGYWAEKYAEKSAETIREFEKKLNSDTSDIDTEDLYEDTKEELRKNDRKFYGKWMTSWLGVSGPLFFVSPYTLLLTHEYACPSCVRRERELREEGREMEAEIISNASPSARKYFEKEYGGLVD
jgi:hypothetical protein